MLTSTLQTRRNGFQEIGVRFALQYNEAEAAVRLHTREVTRWMANQNRVLRRWEEGKTVTAGDVAAAADRLETASRLHAEALERLVSIRQEALRMGTPVGPDADRLSRERREQIAALKAKLGWD